MGSDPDTNTVRIRASSTRDCGDQWDGIVVRGNGNLTHAVISDARVGVAVEENGSLSINHSIFEYNGSVTDDVLFERRTIYDPAYVNTLRMGEKGWPGAISAEDADVSISNSIIRWSEGYGISVRGGNSDIDSVEIVHSTTDAALLVETVCFINHSSFEENQGGGLYGYGAELVINDCNIRFNTLEGIYAVGGDVRVEESELSGNLNGGMILRDECRCISRSVLLTGNHLWGIDASWACQLGIDQSALVGNGGNGLSIDYGTTLTIHNSSISYNRMYAIHVGSWSLDDTLDATHCWWGSFPPSTDSTGVNLSAIWDGFDSEGRSKVIVFPVLETPPVDPAPEELTHVQGGVLELSSGWASPGDTVVLRFSPQDPDETSDYTVAQVSSETDTIVCILKRREMGDVFESDIVISDEADTFSPDRISAQFGDRITAFLLADSTISTDLLPADSDPGVPYPLLLDAYPNPFGDILTIQWNAPSHAVLTMYNLAGRQTLKKNLTDATGTIHFGNMELGNLPTGVYMLKLSGNAKIICKRIVHIR